MDNSKLFEWMKKVNKQYGSEIVQIGVEEKDLDLIPFSSPRLNYLSYGGVPRGRITEFYGEESSGKSTLCLDLMANFQKKWPDEYILYIDIEGTYDTRWASNMGVKSDSVVILNCLGQYAEEVFDQVKEAMETGAFGLMILDSIGAMYSKQASEKSFEDKTYGGIALSLTQFVNQSVPIIKRNNIAFIGINQIRENIGNMYNPISTPGGKAWKFACSQRYMCRKGKFLDDKGNEISSSSENPQGHLIEVKLIKSKTCPSDRRIGKCSLFYRTGIRQDIDLLDLAIKFDIIHKGGAWFNATINGNDYKWQGQSKVLEALNTNELLFNSIKNDVNKMLVENPEIDEE
ncbi:MAG: AAA family ATPase [Candidatus Onthovivens sp.]|nr:AAA family ATPase [Candidatus Onthovivens sp.]